VRSVHAPVEGCVSLLSLIPRLIKQSVTVSVAGCGCGWVEHFCRFGSEHVPVFVAGGLARCWVLRGHPCGCVLGAAPGSAVPNASVGVRGGGVGSGVWLCVECCIVDASILLWSSV